MTPLDKIETFRALHRKAAPVLLYNVWDVGSACALAGAGAAALATSSYAVAAAQGYADGEVLPLDVVLQVARRIGHAVDRPVLIDFESGYADAPEPLADTVGKLLECDVAGLNLEDQVIGEAALYPVDQQAQRIAAVRERARARGMPVFINARTDLFLKEPDATRHAALIDEAILRAQHYRRAGADGFLYPG